MSISARRFLPGEHVEIREVLNGKVWTVRPVTVIEYSEDQFVSYLAPGTLIDYPVDVEHGEKCFSMWLSGQWELDKKEFHAHGMLRIAPQGKPFEVFATVLASGGVISWYVNSQDLCAVGPTGSTPWTRRLTSTSRGTLRVGTVGTKMSSRWLWLWGLTATGTRSAYSTLAPWSKNNWPAE